MTTEELNTIVQAVIDKINGQVIDFDVVSSTPASTDLLSAVRPQGDGTYQGVTLKWDDVTNAVTREAKGYRDEAASAKTNVENMKASVDQTVSDFNTLAEQKKAEVQGVYQTDLNELKGDLVNLCDTTRNILNIKDIKGNGIIINDNVVIGKGIDFYTNFSKGNSFGITFEENTQYTLSLFAKTSQDYASTGDGLVIRFKYTDDTQSVYKVIPNSQSDYSLFTITSDAGKTVSGFVFSYSSAGENVWYLKNFQVEKGIKMTEYIPHNVPADVTSREYIAKLYNEVPEYYKEHIFDAVARIKNNMENVGKNGETFVFITDIHWDTNDKNSPKLVDYILKNTNVRNVFSGGDLINEGDVTEFTNYMLDCVKKFSLNGIPFITAFGNHDDNSNQSDTSKIFTFDMVYSIMQKQMEGIVTFATDTDCTFYFDNKATKTRFIVVDTRTNGTINYDSMIAISNIMKDTPSNWHIIFISHMYKSNMNYSTPTTGINALLVMADGYNERKNVSVPAYSFNVDFTNADSRVECMFSGHLHRNLNFVSEGGIPIIITDTDCGKRTLQTDYPYTKGTVSEQCFDVATIDYVNKTIKCVRIGRGVDREFTY